MGAAVLAERSLNQYRSGKRRLARRLLKQAEALAITPEDRLYVAHGWIELGERKRSLKSLSQLESMTDFSNPLTNEMPPRDHDLARLCLRIGETTRMQAHLAHLRDRAFTLDHWHCLAEILFGAGRPHEARAAFGRAVEEIVSAGDYLRLGTLAARMGEQDEALSLVLRSEPVAKDHADLISLSKLFHELGNAEQARRALDRAAGKSENPERISECVEILIAWGYRDAARRVLGRLVELPESDARSRALFRLYETLGDAGDAQVQMDRAGASAREPQALCEWAMLCIERERRDDAARLIETAEGQAEKPEDWFLCGWVWAQAGDRSRADNAVVRGERLSNSFEDWIAGFEANLGLDIMDGAKRCLAGCEDHAGAFYPSRYRCAAAWAQLGSREGVDRWLDRAAEAGGVGLLDIATQRAAIVGANDASMLLKTAIAGFRYPSDWIHHAEACWKLGLSDLAADNMLIAETKHETVGDLIWCASVWRSYGDLQSAKRCLRRVTELSGSAMDLAACCEAWKNHGDYANARETLERAEAAATDTADIIHVGGVWGWAFGEHDRRRALIDRAETGAVSCYELYQCARDWHLLGDTARAESCLTRAEPLAEDTDDWDLCAMLWTDLDEHDRAKACYEKSAVLRGTP